MDYSKYSILIVDDEPYYRNSVRTALELELGSDITEVDNGVEALDYLRNEKPDLILLDINMPLMDGITFLEEIRNDDQLQNLAVIPYTQETSDETAEKMKALGITDYIIKGIDIDKLIGKIKEALNSPVS